MLDVGMWLSIYFDAKNKSHSGKWIPSWLLYLLPMRDWVLD
jgi:hypothetical protein